MAQGDSTVAFRGRQAIDALVYGLAITVLVLVVSTAVSFTLGSNWLGVKYLLFFVGIGLFGIASFKLRPASPWRGEARRLLSGEDEQSWIGRHVRLPTERESDSRFQATLQRVPPLDRYGLAPDDRLSDGLKLFLASLFVLGVSFGMETVFGVVR